MCLLVGPNPIVSLGFNVHLLFCPCLSQVGYAYPGLAPDAVRLLSPHGSLLALRHEMRYPFAVWLVQQAAVAPVAGAGTRAPFGSSTGVHLQASCAVPDRTPCSRLSATPHSSPTCPPGGRNPWPTADLPLARPPRSPGALDTLRRYDISYVVRSGRLARSLPSSFCQADLDLLHPAGMAHTDRGRLLAEAEAIKAVTQVGATVQRDCCSPCFKFLLLRRRA